jgi:transposase
MEGLGYSTVEMRIRAVQAVLAGTPVVQVAQAHGVDRTTLHRWLQRHQDAGGIAGLQRRPVSGRPRKLQCISEYNLKRIVLAPASRFGFETDLWTVGRLHAVLVDRFNEDVSEDTIWRRLRDAGLTWQTPEREYFQADAEVRQRWQSETIPQIRQTLEKTKGILYCQDEASVCLTPILGKTWSMRGQPRKVKVTGNRASVSAMSALSPRGRLVFRLHEKRITSVEVIDFLGQLLSHHPRRHVIVVMDQARPHTSHATKAYIESRKRLHVFYLPPYSPDWNPDEKVWNHLKNHELKAHRAQSKQELYELAEEKLENMSEDQALLQGLYFRCCVAELLR